MCPPLAGCPEGGLAGPPGTIPPVSAATANANRSPATDPLAILHEVYGYPGFRGAQQAIVEHAIGGGDALVLMPTGGGKSLCYQIPAIARHRAGQGVTVVVSPLIALMHDQVGALDRQLRAVTLFSCVRTHPSTWRIYRDKAAQLQAEIESALPAERYATAIARGQACTLDELVAMLLG